MVFVQVIAGFHALINVIGLPMNLLVIVTIALEKRFHVMRYILLASLAVSDFLSLLLINSFRIGSIAKERWLYGKTMCDLNPTFVRYFYLNTVLHLIAISYERYSAIVKSPMTYNGTITKRRVALMIFIWVAPIPFSIGPLLGWGQYVYNPEVFSCEQAWGVHNDTAARRSGITAIIILVLPSLLIVYLNWSVFKTARTLQHNVIQVGAIEGSETSENPAQEMARRRSERKAAVDVCIVIAAFMVCFLPGWILGLCRQFLRSLEVPAEAILVNTMIFFISTLCNPIIYSIRKREFRAAVKKLFRRMGIQCGRLEDDNNNNNNNQIGLNNIAVRGNIGTEAASQAAQSQDSQIGMNNITINIGTEASTARPVAAQAAQSHDNQIGMNNTEESTTRPVAPQAAQSQDNQTGMNNITVRASIGTEESTTRPAAPQAAQYQDKGFYVSTGRIKVTLQSGRLSPILEEIT